MKPIELKQVLNSAHREIKNCCNQLNVQHTKMLNLVAQHYNTIPKALVMGSGYCKNQHHDISGACFFQCDECKKQSIEQKALLLKIIPVVPSKFFL